MRKLAILTALALTAAPAYAAGGSRTNTAKTSAQEQHQQQS